MVSRNSAFGLLIGAAVGTLFLVPAHVSAQAAPTRESSVNALEVGQPVRVRATDALSIEGVFLGLEGQDMLLRTTPADQARRVPVDRLEALWVRKRATGKGAKIGVIAGGVLGVGLGIIIGPIIENIDCGNGAEVCDRPSTFEVAVVLGALGALGGGAAGGLIGYLVRSWSPVWP